MESIWQTQFILEYIIGGIGLLILLIIPRYSRVFWSLKADIGQSKFSTHNRLKSIDTIKGLAIVGVIIIHSCYLLFSKYSSGIAETIALSLINNTFRFAIPVFLFSSGLLLKPFIWRAQNILQFYATKVFRILIPYIFVNLVLAGIDYNNSAPLWQLILTGDMAIPFYFVPVLFQLYLLYPILDYIRHISPRYLLLGALIISVISFVISDTWQFYGVPLCGQYLVFFVYGMVRQDILEAKSAKIWSELLIIYFVLEIILLAILFIFGFNQNTWELIYFYNFQPLLGFGFIFVSVYYLQSQKLGYKFMQKTFATLGKLSLWIFLLHFPIQQFLFNNIQNIDIGIIIVFIYNFGLTLIISLSLAFIINKIYNILQYTKT